MLKFTDTHSHLYLSQFDSDKTAVVERALKVLDAIYLPNIDMETIPSMLELRHLHNDFFFPMIGLHPCSVKEDFRNILEEMEAMLIAGNLHGEKTFFGIGETGLDMYWDKTRLAIQKEALLIQIEWAKKYNLPIILHCRETLDEAIEMIEKESTKELRGIFHCFDGNLEQAQRIASIPGFKMGIGGIITYKKSSLPEIISQIDLKHFVLETDSPFLPPTPHRGKRNESSYIPLIAQQLAEIQSTGLKQVCEITNRNVAEVFG